MGTASEETLGLYREGDSDGASGVTDLCGLLDLPEALGTNHDGKGPAFVDHPDPSPNHLRPARRTEKALREPEGRPSSTPYARKSMISASPRPLTYTQALHYRQTSGWAKDRPKPGELRMTVNRS
jgi:hypothetical protein